MPPADGVSLVDVMNGSRHDLKLEAYSESLYPERFGWSPLRSLRDGRFKLIDAPRPELYDLEEDSVEGRNIYDERRALAEKMTARLATVAKGRGSASTVQSGRGVSPELQAQLASLGYVGGGKRAPPGRTARPDPKDCIGSDTQNPGSLPFAPACAAWRPADDLDSAFPPPPPR